LTAAQLSVQLKANFRSIDHITQQERWGFMTKSELVERLAKAGGVTKRQAQALMEGLVTTVVGSVKKGDPVKIPDLGTFRKVQSKARMGRNPQTGEPVKIPARKKVRFSVAKSFKVQVLGAAKK
jgi:Bacterial nucleoid DNA-binding protein